MTQEPTTTHAPDDTAASAPDASDASVTGTAPAGTPAPGASFTGRIGGRAMMRAAIIAGAVAIVAGGAAFASAASPDPSAGTDAGASADPGDGLMPFGGGRGPRGDDGLGFGLGDRGDRGGRAFAGRTITITAINGSSVSLKSDDGWTRTITVTSSTTITKGGQTVAVGDLEVGDTIHFRQTRADDGSYSIDAIVVAVPTVAGEVTDVSASSFTVEARDGTTWTITTNASTDYDLGRSEDGARTDVVDGARVVVFGEQGTGNALTATNVTVRGVHVAGEVTAKTGNSITLTTRGGTTVTVQVDADTTIQVVGVDDADLADVTVGMVLVAEGRQLDNGTIDASALVAGDRGTRGLGGGRGFGNGPFAPDASASPSTSS